MLHVSFEGIYTTFEYDAATGRLKAKRFFDNEDDYNAGTPAQVWLFAYDAFGRQTKVERRDGASATLRLEETAYDRQGRVTSVSSPEGTVHYEYDALGRRVRTYTGTTADPVNDTLYNYDELGRLETVTAVERNNQAVDSDDAAAGDQPAETRYEYDLLGNLDEEYEANGTIADYEYDSLNRLTSLVHYGKDATPDDLTDNPVIASFDYTVRADGKRTGVTETLWQNGTATTNDIDWTYDNLGRLTIEEIDSTDNSLDQTQSFTYDLAGNRLEENLDKGNVATIDETTTYDYDANDRLLEEVLDFLNGLDETTEYDYGPDENGDGVDDWTIQTGKTVKEDGDLKTVKTNTYNLQGRMESVTVETYDANGQDITRRERTSYKYNFAGIRISAYKEDDAGGDGVYETAKTTTFLSDPHNHTGYAQVLEEVTTDAASNEITRVVYAIGHDQVSQTVYDAANPNGVTHTFHTDGHGSTRVLTDLFGAVAQTYSFDAYGNAIGFDPAAALTSFLYSSEHFDARTSWQYLRGRWMRDGRFNRVDPWIGNFLDPQSLHKYLYTHGDPVNGVDPSGMWNTGMTIASIGIATTIAGLSIFGPEVSRPSFGESLIPVYGSGWSAVYNYQQGHYFLGTFYTGLAVSDIFLVRAVFGYAWKALVGRGTATAVGTAGASKATATVFTKIPADDVTKIATSTLFKTRTEGLVYGSTVKDAPIWRTLLSPFKEYGGIIRWEGDASQLFVRHEVTGWFSGLKSLLGQQTTKRIGNVNLLRFTPLDNEIVVHSAEIVSKHGTSAVTARIRYLGRIATVDYGIPHAAPGLVDAINAWLHDNE